jgi:hypothetical protein
MSPQDEANILLALHQKCRSPAMRTTSDLLAAIEAKSSWLRQDAKFLSDFVSQLKLRRDFPTLAEEGMDMAEAELIAALGVVRRARAAYLAKPVEHDPYVRMQASA